jgi:hypothetical protein
VKVNRPDDKPTPSEPVAPRPAVLDQTFVKACSFCNRGRRDVKTIVTGPTVSICDECVEQAAKVIAEDMAEQSEAASEPAAKPEGADLSAQHELRMNDWRQWTSVCEATPTNGRLAQLLLGMIVALSSVERRSRWSAELKGVLASLVDCTTGPADTGPKAIWQNPNWENAFKAIVLMARDIGGGR